MQTKQKILMRIRMKVVQSGTIAKQRNLLILLMHFVTWATHSHKGITCLPIDSHKHSVHIYLSAYDYTEIVTDTKHFNVINNNTSKLNWFTCKST